MTKKKLKQYRALSREIPKLQMDIDKLYERLEDVPIVSGKVTKSGDDFPYIEEHITVKMTEPKAADEIKKQIRIKESRMKRAEQDRTEIEHFIARIENSTDRQLFELIFLEGESQAKAGQEVGYSQSRVSEKIAKYINSDKIDKKMCYY